MSHIAIIKVRSSHDLEFEPPPGLLTALGLLGQRDLLRRIHRSTGQPFMPQLSLPYLAALGHQYNAAHGTSHTFELVDEPEDRIPLDMKADLALLTVFTPNAPASYRISDALRARSIPTVLGGIHASTQVSEAARHATAVAVGEAEGCLFDILADWDRGALQPRYHGGRSAPLDTLPVPRWQDARAEDYAPWLVPVQTSRGCRNACTFCSTTAYQGRRRRHRPVQEVVREICTLKKQGVITAGKTVFFTDNNIVYDAGAPDSVDNAYSRELFDAIAPLNISWVGQGEVDVGDDPTLVEHMAKAGCFLLLVGLESIRQSAVESTGKRCNTVADYERQIDTLHSHGIGIIGCFIFGLDGETPETFQQTRRFVEQWVDVPQLSLLTPFPDTALYRKLKRASRLLHEDWSRYDLTSVIHRPPSMSAQELAAAYTELTDSVYSYGACLRRALRYASRETVNGMPRMRWSERLTAILMPNLVYRNLARVRRSERLVLARRGEAALAEFIPPDRLQRLDAPGGASSDPIAAPALRATGLTAAPHGLSAREPASPPAAPLPSSTSDAWVPISIS